MTSVEGPQLDPRRWRALFVLLMGQFCALLDVSVTNVALPSIGRGDRGGAVRAAVGRERVHPRPSRSCRSSRVGSATPAGVGGYSSSA
ncbi:MAG: hypothetical protein WDM88_00320 [Galbitalea sp.]